MLDRGVIGGCNLNPRGLGLPREVLMQRSWVWKDGKGSAG